MDSMRILLVTNYFPPEIGAASHLFYDLAEGLQARGHSVTVVTGFPRYNIRELPANYRSKLWMSENINGIRVLRIATWPLKRSEFVRKVEYFTIAPILLLAALNAGPHDVALFYSPPITLGFTAACLGRLTRIPIVYNVQDIHPDALMDLGFLHEGDLLRLLKLAARFAYRSAAFVTVHSQQNLEYLKERYVVPDEKLKVIPNWVDTDALRPGAKDNWFRKEYGLDGKFVISFAGTMGTSQDLDIVLDASLLLREYSDIQIVLVGDGLEKSRLQQRVAEAGLSNVTFIPMQPRDKYPGVLHASDVCLVTLKPGVVTPVVPSKLLSIMAAGRCMVAAVDPRGDAPEIIRRAQCGFCVTPSAPRDLADAVLAVYRSPDRGEAMGLSGRRFVETHFSRDLCVSLYEDLFSSIKLY